jgi:cytochrome c-type biogenesis protein CcmH/NrfF
MMRNRMMQLRSWRAGMQLMFVALTALLLLGASDTSPRFNDLGHKLMCTCGCGQVLLECNHVGCPSSDRMRGELAAAIDRGDNDDLTLQGFVQKYGSVVLAAPTTTGFNRVAWIVPYLALGVGLTGVIVLVRTWKLRRIPAPVTNLTASSPAEMDALRRRVHEETEL